MRKALLWCTVLVLILLAGSYIWCLLAVWNNTPIWKIIVSLLCYALNIIIFIALLFSLYNSRISELFSGFKFEMLQLALISAFLSFVIIRT